MAIRKRERTIGSVTPVTRDQKRIISKKISDYSKPYMELLTKAQESQQLQDPYLGLYNGEVAAGAGLTPIEPIYCFNSLIKIFIESTIVRQCVESYVVNIESYGHILEYTGPIEERHSKEAKDEYDRIGSFLNNISPDMTLTEVRSKSRWDFEVTGNRAFEVIRDNAGRIIMFDHIPASTVRMTKRSRVPVDIEVTLPDPDKAGGTITRTIPRYFRLFMQWSYLGERIYFKEFGDPRIIDPKTGQEDPNLPTSEQATEIYYDSQYIPGQVYGLPRWLGALPAILGSKEAELVNLNFFRDNAIPAMAVMVSNGALTNESFDKLEEYFLAIKGEKSMNRIILLEATSDDAGGSTEHSQPAPKITMQPLISDRQQEGLFQGYDQNNQQKVRSSFRLPPIYVGRAEDYTRASAVASMLIAENQVFIPERSAFDFMMNNKILSTHNIKYWTFRSIGAPITDGDTITKMVGTMAEQGALTPNSIIKLANQFLNVSLDPVKDEWGDVPFAAIKLMLRSGTVIKGFDSFIKEVSQPPTIGVVDPSVKPKPDVAADIKKYISTEIENVITDMNNELQISANMIDE